MSATQIMWFIFIFIWSDSTLCRNFLLHLDASLLQTKNKKRVSKCLPATTWPKAVLFKNSHSFLLVWRQSENRQNLYAPQSRWYVGIQSSSSWNHQYNLVPMNIYWEKEIIFIWKLIMWSWFSEHKYLIVSRLSSYKY